MRAQLRSLVRIRESVASNFLLKNQVIIGYSEKIVFAIETVKNPLSRARLGIFGEDTEPISCNFGFGQFSELR